MSTSTSQFMKRCYTNIAVWLLSIVFSNVLLAQATIQGTLQDENKQPITGATIAVEGTSLGAISDFDGNFIINNVPAKKLTINISFLGYQKITQEIDLTANKDFKQSYTMKDDNKLLDELVVVGYGTQRKRDLMGSVAKLDADKLNDQVGASFETALQGKLAGVQLTQSSGAAGGNSVIRIRGVGSISAGGAPLVVLDGVPLSQENYLQGERGGQNNNPLSSINPNDIESITVLKDAASTAIYGARGGNGVILITSKRAKTGKPSLAYSVRVGISVPSKVLSVLNSNEWLQIQQEAWENDGNVGRYVLPKGLSYDDIKGLNTDWIKETIQTGFKHEHDLSYKFGNNFVKSFLGVSYSKSDSYLKGNSFERISGRGNFDFNLSKKLKATLSTSLTRGLVYRVPQAWAGGLGLAQSTALPIFPIYKNQFPTNSTQYDSAGYYNIYSNPVAQRELTDYRTREWRAINSVNLTYLATPDWSFSVQGNYDYSLLGDYQLEQKEWTGTSNIAKSYEGKINNYSAFATTEYRIPLPNKHHDLRILGGIEYQDYNVKRRDFEIDSAVGQIYTVADYQKQVAANSPYRDQEIWRFASFFGKLNYNIDNKYFAQLVFRRDGSSKFGRNKRFANFPSIGLGYVMSEEPWFNKGIVNYLKLKASWGKSGNSNIPYSEQWATFDYILPGQTNNGLSYNGQPTAVQRKLANPNLSWEVATTTEGGFDIGMFNDRFTAGVTYYNKTTTDALLRIALQASAGLEDLNYYSNVGKIENKGLEIEFTSHNITNKTFSWTTEFNIAFNKNKVLDVGTATPDALDGGYGDIRVIKGQPVGTNYLVRFSHVDAATGRPVWLDVNGKETFEYNVARDRVPAGNIFPDYIGGITNTFKYKNFDLSALFVFSIGGKIYDDAAKRQLGVITDDWNYFPDVFDRWRQPGDIATFPRLTRTMINWGGNDNPFQNNSTLWLYDASFGRLRNLTIGYNFKLKNKVIKSMRAYFTGTNLFLISKYRGWDPELARGRENEQQRNVGGTNITYLTPPQEKAYVLGVNVEF